MKRPRVICCSLFVLCSSWVSACELPSDESFYVDSMQEERALTSEALAKSEQVFVGTVSAIHVGAETPDPADRTSMVEVDIHESLMGSFVSGRVVSLTAHLHHTTSSCFGNEAFWDDQVEIGRSYIFFVHGGRILTASPPATSWKRLGLSGQREIVIALTRKADEA